MSLSFFVKKLNRSYVWLLFILILGGVLRLINMGAEPFWCDEVLHLDIVKHFSNSIPTMLQYLREVEVHPPLYHLVLHFWINWFGDNEFAVRFLSFIFGLGSIIGVYALGKVLFKKENVALLAAFITAILPIQIEYSQEARPYIIFCFFGILAIIGFWRFRETQKIRFIILYLASSLIGVYLHYSFILFLSILTLYWFLDIFIQNDKDKTKSFLYWLWVHAAIFIGFFWWLDAFLLKIELSKYQIFGLSKKVTEFRSQFLYEQIFHQLIWMAKEKFSSLIVVIGIMVSQISIIFFFGNALLKKKDLIVPVINQYKKQIFFLLFLLFGLIILFIFSPQSINYSTIYYRHVIIGSILISLLLAFFFSLLEKKHLFMVVAIFAISLVPFITSVVSNDAEWDYDFTLKDVGTYINENYREGDLVISFVSTLRSNLNHFLNPNIEALSLLPANYTGIDVWNSRQTLGFIENEYMTRAEFSVSREEFIKKFTYLDKKYSPKRIWVFVNFDDKAYDWFRKNNWRHTFKAIPPIFPLDLFTRP